MHLCERLGKSEKFVRVTAAVGGQPDLPARLCIPLKPAGVPVRLRPCAPECRRNSLTPLRHFSPRADRAFDLSGTLSLNFLATCATGNGKRRCKAWKVSFGDSCATTKFWEYGEEKGALRCNALLCIALRCNGDFQR
jgi:hypothetical protein